MGSSDTNSLGLPAGFKLEDSQNADPPNGFVLEGTQGVPLQSHETVLSNAIKANPAPTPLWQNSDIGKIIFQGINGRFGNAPQNIAENPITTAMSGLPGVQMKSGEQGVTGLKSLIMGGNKISPETTDISDEWMNPKSLVGKVLGVGANFAGASIPGTQFASEATGVPAAQRGLQETENALKNVGVESEALSYRASQDIPKAADKLMKTKNAEFGEKFKNIESSMTPDDYAEILDKTIADHGEDVSPDVQVLKGHMDNILTSKGAQSEFNPLTMTNETSESGALSKEYLQAKNKEIFNSLSKRGQAIYTKHFLDKLPEAAPGLKEAKADIAPVYDSVVGAKKLLKQPRFKEIALGDPAKISVDEVSDLQNAEKPIGTNFIERAINLGKENQQLLGQKKIDATTLAGRKGTAQFIGKGIAAGSEYLGLRKLYDLIAGQKDH